MSKSASAQVGTQLQRFRDAVHAAVWPLPMLFVTVGSAVTAFVVFMLLSFPAYSRQLLAADVFYLDNAVVVLAGNLQSTAGTLGLGLMVVYAALVGITVSVLTISVRTTGVKAAGGVTGFLPGLAAAGCAGCGVGFLSLLGFAGVLSLLPFQGNGVRVAGILLTVFVLVRIGNPRECRV